MAKVLAVGALCAVLLTGCGRGTDRRAGHDTSPATPPATSTTTGTAGGGAGTGTGGGTTGTGPTSADPQISSVDGLLTDLDNQVNSDSQPAQDAD
ncbi:MAG: hypothetical protein AUI14_21230 [Actinobacteria bacterium 13_2_20CM_2_71_6]|nr:MAG: hypothetical protein AUI14_21230 [Actinobacteria bacterium 13_2_20CM_2_71_6]